MSMLTIAAMRSRVTGGRATNAALPIIPFSSAPKPTSKTERPSSPRLARAPAQSQSTPPHLTRCPRRRGSVAVVPQVIDVRADDDELTGEHGVTPGDHTDDVDAVVAEAVQGHLCNRLPPCGTATPAASNTRATWSAAIGSTREPGRRPFISSAASASTCARSAASDIGGRPWRGAAGAGAAAAGTAAAGARGTLAQPAPSASAELAASLGCRRVASFQRSRSRPGLRPGPSLATVPAPMSLAELPVGQPFRQPRTTYHLLAGGEVAFTRILERIADAERSIEMRCFEWRADETGDLVGRALLRRRRPGRERHDPQGPGGDVLRAPRRDQAEFFHKRIGLIPRLQTWSLMICYGRPGSLRQKPSPVADALLAHPNVTVARDAKRFDHAKLYVFDDETVILGGMGIGDDFRHTNVDFMVEVSGGQAAERLADRYEGRALFGSNRPYDFLLHSFRGSARSGGWLAEDRLGLIASARERLTIAMAYLGDPVCTDALVAAVQRGVRVTLLTAARANIIGDLNLWTCAQLLQRTGHVPPTNLRIVLHPRMVHGKAIVGDGAWVDIGSTNFTPPSHGGYEEVDLFCRDAGFAQQVERAIERDIQDGTRASLPIRYRSIYVAVERLLSTVHGRSKTSKFVDAG